MSKVKLKNVSVGYGDKIIIQNINAELVPGRLIVLVGLNGAGKSTLIKSLLKINPILNGTISYDNRGQDQIGIKEWSQYFSAVFSQAESIPQVKVQDLILLGALHRNETLEEREKRLEEVLELIQIRGFKNRLATELSDGQLQKVMLARALMQDTPFVIFDEPTAHLDYANKFKVFDLLHDLAQKTQKCFLVATHEMEWALQIADELWLADEGELHVGIPEYIALSKQIYQKLESEQFKFDYLQGRFVMGKERKMPTIIGTEQEKYWVEQFLKRRKTRLTRVDSVQISDGEITLNQQGKEVRFESWEAFFDSQKE